MNAARRLRHRGVRSGCSRLRRIPDPGPERDGYPFSLAAPVVYKLRDVHGDTADCGSSIGHADHHASYGEHMNESSENRAKFACVQSCWWSLRNLILSGVAPESVAL